MWLCGAVKNIAQIVNATSGGVKNDVMTSPYVMTYNKPMNLLFEMIH